MKRYIQLQNYYSKKEMFPDLLREEETLKKRIQRAKVRLKEIHHLMDVFRKQHPIKMKSKQ